MTDAMMEGLIGHCINAIAAQFAPLPELNPLPAECFSCIVRAAGDMEIPKRTLEAAVLGYLGERVSATASAAAATAADGGSSASASSSSSGGRLSVDEFLDVCKAPGRLDDMRHCEGLFGLLEVMLQVFRGDSEAEALCKGLHEMGFWVCLPHAIIERAYADRNVPDRYCTVALMAENRHLIKVNEQLAEQVEALSDALRAAGHAQLQQQGGGGPHFASSTQQHHQQPAPPQY